MHLHQADHHTGLEFGAREQLRHRLLVDNVGSAAGRPAPTQPKKAEKTDKANGPKPPTATEQVREVIKDGAVNDTEKTVFERSRPAEVVATEQDRLRTAVIAAQGDDLERDDSGRVKVDDGKLVVKPESIVKPTEHERRVERLAETVDGESLDQIDARIEQLEDAGTTVGLATLKELRADRAAEEGKVAGVVKDKLSLIGALEAAKLAESTEDPGAKLDELRGDADKWVEQFNANGGQWHEGNDLFGDDWDESKIDFDTLVKKFTDDPEEIKNFVGSQGADDDHLRGKSTDEVEAYLADLDDTGEATKIALRYQAADELSGIFEEYAAAKETADSHAARGEALDAEIEYLNASMEQDLVGLSTETLDSIEDHITPTAGILDAPQPDKAGTGDKVDKADKVDVSVKPKDGDGTAPAGTSRTRAIDYSSPQQRTKVLRQAQEQQLLPGAGVNFNDKGQAVYTVQPGDSYWRIADQSDGKGPAAFDSQHFASMVASNSERLGRDPQLGLIHPDEQVIIPGRSLDQLVKLLELPQTEEYAAEAHIQRPGFQPY